MGAFGVPKPMRLAKIGSNTLNREDVDQPLEPLTSPARLKSEIVSVQSLLMVGICNLSVSTVSGRPSGPYRHKSLFNEKINAFNPPSSGNMANSGGFSSAAGKIKSGAFDSEAFGLKSPGPMAGSLMRRSRDLAG
ncbi:hypothetical protein ACVBEG_27565 [Pseudomonas sp. GG8]